MSVHLELSDDEILSVEALLSLAIEHCDRTTPRTASITSAHAKILEAITRAVGDGLLDLAAAVEKLGMDKNAP
jgi:hypothetical protein